MDKVLKAKLTNFAVENYEYGHSGGAYAITKLVKPISAEKVSEIKEMFRPKIASVLDTWRAMPKHEFNKKCWFEPVTISTKVNADDIYNTRLDVYVDECGCATHYVNGRRINTVLSLDEAMGKAVIYQWFSPTNDWHDTHRKRFIVANDDGSFSQVKYDAIIQEPITITRRGNWGRGKMRNSFIKLVLENAQKYLDAGYEFIGVNDRQFMFKKANQMPSI